ncbi:response regulator transcription factor [Filobacillus milosensis]|uniref:Response regulator transcription factor n=1 Tax=Filobacillus milosensis TaxID=94137 RepID=A0A4Y8IR24_9BACI|nr:response regulator transcription factor [Filobacillus milosensis]TFB24261.1 response regulator transcription factor [Filobacillus milosensis]
MKQIAVIEDDPHIQRIVQAYLSKANYDVIVMDSAEKGLEMWETNPPDMWIVDIMLPQMDGYDFCKKIREKSNVPIIIISAKGEDVDKILGLELGGDDYLTKPFSPGELVARVKRLFKRVNANNEEEQETHTVRINDLVIELTERRAFWRNEELDLTSKEYELITLLAKHPNRAFSREELLDRVWGDDYFGSDRAVDDLVKRLRKKLNEVPIETVWGFGYRLKVDGEHI